MSIKRIIKKINSSKSFLITAHVGLEGDALGSELAVYLLLKRLGKQVMICNQDHTPSPYRFLPHVRSIKNDVAGKRFNVAMVLDCSDSSRAGRVKDALDDVPYIINIDHHISNTMFGDLNWVDASAGSTCQMLYVLCEHYRIMDKNIALCLYTGISTDTGNFTYANTTPETHRVVYNLLRYKLEPHRIDERLHSLCQPQDLRLINDIIASLRYDVEKKICWARIEKWEEKDYDLTEVIFSMMRLLRGFEVFILFKTIGKNRIRVNFRSRSRVDVNEVAQFFGGGGHKRASGTTIEETLAAAQKKVISFVRSYVHRAQSR
ncbi:MAG: bifunctional oligoribonuclease/PAP phosphatase NrnA [Candidatus Omnitrophota bacterium]|nr:bifunctional oligoribonuclease/PAP phosphatase NrnA [Candidatus Omnitrophota bacterium]